MSNITKFCIQECERQNDLTTEAVAGMVEAYCSAVMLDTFDIKLELRFLLEMATMIKPQNTWFRQTPVTFANGQQGARWDAIPRLIDAWFEALDKFTPEEAYYEFEKIHPFEDGNGRVGAIIYNWLNGTLSDPIVPPNMFEQKT